MYSIYENRELSWLKFNERVLDEAADESTPPLEKLRFLSIVTSNLDEFYMVRVGSLSDRVKFAKQSVDDKSGMNEQEQIQKIFKKTATFYKKQEPIFHQVMDELACSGVRMLSLSQLEKGQLSYVKKVYQREILPLLSPQIVDGKQPFLHLENRLVYCAFHLKRKEKTYLALIHRTASVPPLIELPCSSGFGFLLTEEVILSYAAKLFSDYEILESCFLKVTRNADLQLPEAWYDEENDYRDLMKDILKKRVRLSPVRMELSKAISRDFKKLLCRFVDEKLILINPIPLSFAFFSELERKLSKELRQKLSFPPVLPQLPPWYHSDMNLMEAVEKDDYLLSYPYESTRPFFHLLEEAVNDPDVISVKVTLYRLSHHSRMISLLLKAAELGKEVLAVMELRARFDEENNINYSEILEQAGVQVLYGFGMYKIHSKILLITKKRGNTLHHIVHLGTGNYNEKTAQLYTDMNLLTSNRVISEDAVAFFHNIAIGNIHGKYQQLSVSPFGIGQTLCDLIDEEIRFQKEYGDGYIIMKCNSLTSKPMIDKLVEAGRAGVKIKLIIRGICCLLPGIKGETDNISVVSIVGRFLEHSRIYYFNHHQEKKIYLSSADLMTRNLERRVEIAVPILKEELKQKLTYHLLMLLSDDTKARALKNDGTYQQKESENHNNAQAYFCSCAKQEAQQACVPKRKSSKNGLTAFLRWWNRWFVRHTERK